MGRPFIVIGDATLGVIGLIALATFLLLGADALKLGLVWAAVALGCVVLLWGGLWALRRWRAHRAARALEAAMDAESARAVQAAPDKENRAEITALRERMQAAVKTIKTSKLGLTSGSASLYELPWYAVIGNPAAGKSTAVVRSGLNFPFSDKSMSVIQGIGGTRNCDWFFTTEGILLDTAGRYAIHEEDRGEWLGFLSLLKRHRPKAPLNGVIIAASLSELSGNRPEFAIALAKQLRQRVQELTERLEIFAPVYVVFTKADLVSGFCEFFDDREPAERERVWGATLPYDTAAKTDAVAAFEQHFDALHDGLKEASVARMSMHRGDALPPGVLTFPLEFASLKAPLRTFISTLFEDNPYQFRPIFRGFYFTSAVQQGESTARASSRVAERFALSPRVADDSVLAAASAAPGARDGSFFLRQLFSKVIFADQMLVQQYTSRRKLRWRYAAFMGAALLLGTALAGWTWSYVGNRQLVANVQADLNKAIKLQDGRTDLQPRLQALEIVQDRVAQLQRYRQERPWSLTLGLYQGDAIEQRLRATYLAGLHEVMLKPASQTMASYLGEVNEGAANLKPVLRTPGGSPASAQGGADPNGVVPGVYVAASPTSVADAYNALKAYIMLGDRGRMEPGHLGDQVTRFWRVWLEATRNAILGRVRELYGAGRVVDLLGVGPVQAPPDWIGHVQKMLDPQLRQISRGQITIHGNDVDLKGDVTSEDERLRQAARLTAVLNPTYAIRNGLRAPSADQSLLDEALANRIIEFERGSSVLRPAGLNILNQMAAVLRRLGNKKVEVIGHTDGNGLRETNLQLSLARAEAVRDYLASQGISPAMITTTGLGPDQPVATNDTPEGRARNRRIEFKIAPG